MAVTLGKDCTVSVGGSITGVRSVTFSKSAQTIDIEPYSGRAVVVYSTGYDASVQLEINDSASMSTLFTALQNGTVVTVTGGAGSWSFPAVLTGISESDPIDGVATFSVEARMTMENLR